jgi:hypothetical protein
MWKTIQTKANNGRPVQLILDMKVRWSSTYLMLDRAERKKDVRSKFQVKINLFIFCSALILLLMSFDGKNKTLLNAIRFVSSSLRVRNGYGSTPSLVC